MQKSEARDRSRERDERDKVLKLFMKRRIKEITRGFEEESIRRYEEATGEREGINVGMYFGILEELWREYERRN